ncbi:TatD family hydrolase [Desulforhopalus sp. 52FAK]
MNLIDSHCHLNHPKLATQLGTVLVDAKRVGVEGYIIPGVVAAQWKEILALGSTKEGRYCAVGLHPLFMQEHRNPDLVLLEKLCEENRIVAIGEIGLDFFYGREKKKDQQLLFEQQLDIASRTGLPIILHVRKAHNEVLATLKRKHFTNGGSVHAFNGSLQQAEQYIELNFVIGVGGAITYDRAKKIRMMVNEVPVHSIILETDSPDMLVSGKDTGPNLPQYLPEVLYELARLKQIPPEQLAEIIGTTTLNIFNLR